MIVEPADLPARDHPDRGPVIAALVRSRTVVFEALDALGPGAVDADLSAMYRRAAEMHPVLAGYPAVVDRYAAAMPEQARRLRRS